MEKKDNRFAFRASDDQGDFIRQMSAQSGWDSSEVIRFAVGYWMMHVKTGMFAAFGQSQYGYLLKDINISSKGKIPDGDVQGIVELSDRYAKAYVASMNVAPPPPDVAKVDNGVNTEVKLSEAKPVAPPVEQKKRKRKHHNEEEDE